MAWAVFAISTALLVYFSIQLANYGDVIAVRTRLGGMFIGILLLAAATSLPEFLTSINSLQLNTPDLAAGNLLGSNTFNMLLLAVLDLANNNQRLLRSATLKHALTGSLAIFLIGMVVFFMLANLEWQIGWVGVDSILLILAYFGAIYLIRKNAPKPASKKAPIPKETPPLWLGLLGFVLSVAGLVVVTPYMVASSAEIAEITGLGTTFVGATLVAAVTSLPELITTLAAVKLGADDMAIGNLFGSTLFNMFALGVTDIFYTQGRYLSAIDPSFLIVAMLGLLMTGLGLIGNVARLEKKLFFIEIDAALLILLYFGGMWLLFSRSMMP